MPIYQNSAPPRRRTQTLKIRNGFGGNLDTVSQMRLLARKRAGDPRVREAALAILRAAGTSSHDYLSEALAVGDYVKSRVSYVRDPDNIEHLQDPVLMLRDIDAGRAAGDCDDMSLLIATLLLSIGCQPWFRTVRYSGSTGAYNHIYVVAYEGNYHQPKRRVVLDAILKDRPIGSEIPHTSGDEYKV